MQIEGKRGPGSPKMTVLSGNSTRLTLLIGMCGDPMRDVPCVQLHSCLVGSPLMWMMLLHLHVNLNADDDDTLVSPGMIL